MPDPGGEEGPAGKPARLTEADLERAALQRSIDASEQERRRWARELHDDTLQELGALKLGLEAAQQADEPGRLAQAVTDAVGQVDLTIKSLQSLITELRPAALDELGVGPALDDLFKRTGTTSGLEIEPVVNLAYETGRADSRLAPEVESAVYRIVQESLTNVVKHARAERVEVDLEEQEGRVTVTVRDDGCGFDVEHRSRGFGLVGMRERTALHGGELSVESAPGHGTVIRAIVATGRAGC
jgi:signal transduction histidine kinase